LSARQRQETSGRCERSEYSRSTFRRVHHGSRISRPIQSGRGECVSHDVKDRSKGRSRSRSGCLCACTAVIFSISTPLLNAKTPCWKSKPPGDQYECFVFDTGITGSPPVTACEIFKQTSVYSFRSFLWVVGTVQPVVRRCRR
jgi:hypothetical protein